MLMNDKQFEALCALIDAKVELAAAARSARMNSGPEVRPRLDKATGVHQDAYGKALILCTMDADWERA